ncbi:FGGY carbohydrate kinase domain-containing protein-like [Dendronephthya gigantea]|uniref:FGGY carbohydrate kinase domain-containing protein-like n=1 Tax=Dendronephthya gigantea TaxID=151771 RepID=UPI001069D5DE|nr:FGGY carbohydrate kinase domain-containing protein-like [Dendronephthya gigantea]
MQPIYMAGNNTDIDSGAYLYIAVDVGTSSVRTAVVDREGRIIEYSSEDISIWQPSPELYELSSENIWKCLCSAVRKACSKVNKGNIRGIGFDATCSLVALDKHGNPVSITPNKATNRNIILWLDHRAVKEAEIINTTGHDVLKFVGGKISPEMQAPKILWCKKNLEEERWKDISVFFDLPEFLTFKATGSYTRSLCSLVCKFNYMGHSSQQINGNSGWIPSFWSGIGLSEFVEDDFRILGGNSVSMPGKPLAHGLSVQAAQDLDLPTGLPVATSLIDAHAGGLGVIGAAVKKELSCESLTSRLAIISGTSSCHMAIDEQPLFVDGVWGPYYSAMVPDLWLNEGGQSATGKVIDHILETHPAWTELVEKAKQSACTVYEKLYSILEESAQDQEHYALLTNDYHVYPDFHGNRSPIADPTLKGMVTGLTLTNDLKSLAVLYLATIQALSCGTRQIIERLNSCGHNIKAIFICGGLSKNPLFVQCHADVTGLPLVLPRETDSVLVGSAILAAYAAGDFKTMKDAMACMSSAGNVLHPNSSTKRFYEKKYQVFQKMYQDQLDYRRIMC